jgi:hypothetical protein
VGGYDGGAALASLGSSVRVVSLQMETNARAEVGSARVRAGRELCTQAVQRWEPLCARWNAGVCAR